LRSEERSGGSGLCLFQIGNPVKHSDCCADGRFLAPHLFEPPLALVDRSLETSRLLDLVRQNDEVFQRMGETPHLFRGFDMVEGVNLIRVGCHSFKSFHAAFLAVSCRPIFADHSSCAGRPAGGLRGVSGVVEGFEPATWHAVKVYDLARLTNARPHAPIDGQVTRLDDAISSHRVQPISTVQRDAILGLERSTIHPR
jgi:hypothetical protein